jgi:hypothetical protein
MAEPVIRYAWDDRQEKLIEKHVKKTGFKAKITAKCIECIYDPIQMGSWRKQVENCTAPDCPLFSVRPVTTNRGKRNDKQ